MACKAYGPLLSAYADGELSEEDKGRVEEHIKACAACGRELEALVRLREDMGRLPAVEVPEMTWDEYPAGVYNRVERNFGLLCVVAGTVVAVLLGLVAFACDPTVPGYAKIVVGVIGLGLLGLLSSVARQRCRESKTDPYKRIVR